MPIQCLRGFKPPSEIPLLCHDQPNQLSFRPDRPRNSGSPPGKAEPGGYKVILSIGNKQGSVGFGEEGQACQIGGIQSSEDWIRTIDIRPFSDEEQLSDFPFVRSECLQVGDQRPVEEDVGVCESVESRRELICDPDEHVFEYGNIAVPVCDVADLPTGFLCILNPGGIRASFHEQDGVDIGSESCPVDDGFLVDFLPAFVTFHCREQRQQRASMRRRRRLVVIAM